jgi:LysM domain
MSKVRQIVVTQFKFIALVGAPLLFVAGCSNAPTCAEGNTSEACRIRGGPEYTSSVNTPRNPYRETTGSIARPVVSRPATVYVQPYPQQVVYAPTQRQLETRRLARLQQRVASCEATATIPRYRETTASIPRYRETTGSISAAARYSPTTPVRSVWHVVAPGETLSAIARRYEISVVDIARINELRNFPQIRSGTMILIPLT